jgi:hypothetical protein
MEDKTKEKKSRKLLGIILTIVFATAGGMLYYALLPTVPQIELTDISYDWLPVIGHEWMPPMELRVSMCVKNMENFDYEVDIQFEATQNGEESRIKNLVFVIEAMQEQEITVYIGFLNPDKEVECTAQIVRGHRVS